MNSLIAIFFAGLTMVAAPSDALATTKVTRVYADGGSFFFEVADGYYNCPTSGRFILGLNDKRVAMVLMAKLTGADVDIATPGCISGGAGVDVFFVW